MKHKNKPGEIGNQTGSITPGTPVQTLDGATGQVQRVVVNQKDISQIDSVLIRLQGHNEEFSIPANLIDKLTNQGILLLHVESVQLKNQLSQLNQSGSSGEGELRIPIFEEWLKVEKKLVDLGEVVFHKSVEQSEQVTSVPLSREELEIVREPVNNEPLDKPLETQYEGDWLIIPVMREIVVVKKQLVLTERIRVRKHQVVEEQEIRESLRQERVTIEDNSKIRS